MTTSFSLLIGGILLCFLVARLRRSIRTGIVLFTCLLFGFAFGATVKTLSSDKSSNVKTVIETKHDCSTTQVFATPVVWELVNVHSELVSKNNNYGFISISDKLKKSKANFSIETGLDPPRWLNSS